MTADTVPSGESLPGDPTLERLVGVAAAEFVDLGFLAPDGVLDLQLDRGVLHAIRLEGLGGQAIRLQSVAIDADGAPAVASGVEVRASRWRGDLERTFDPARLLDDARPSGTLIDTDTDASGWVEIRFTRPIAVRRLRLRNATDATAKGAKGIRVIARSRWRGQVVYDAGTQLRGWRDRLGAGKADVSGDDDTGSLLDVLDATVRGDYGRAHRLLARVSDDAGRRGFRAAVNDRLLPARGLEWTVHGPQRPFRSWSEEERVDYVRDSAVVVGALGSLTPDVCLGFGSVLSVVRDHALIPHDDDLDIIIGFEPSAAATLSDALALVEGHLRPLGFDVSGEFATHRHVRRPGRKHVDVFVGIFEGETISWYPGARGNLTRAIVFPPASADLLGVACAIPAQAEVYLEALYGPGWRVPDPNFSHRWNLSAYADLTGASTTPAASAGNGPTEPG
jgi:hypothetical protein